jgi:hypothetical protein
VFAMQTQGLNNPMRLVQSDGAPPCGLAAHTDMLLGDLQPVLNIAITLHRSVQILLPIDAWWSRTRHAATVFTCPLPAQAVGGRAAGGPAGRGRARGPHARGLPGALGGADGAAAAQVTPAGHAPSLKQSCFFGAVTRADLSTGCAALGAGVSANMLTPLACCRAGRWST